MITENKEITEISVLAGGFIQLKETTTITKDGEIILSKDHYTSLAPASDLTGVPENVVAICNVAWTPEVVSAYQASLVQPE